MSWVQTAASLITLGFTIYKFYDFGQSAGGIGAVRAGIGPRTFAMLMIAIGVMSLVMASVQHRQLLAALAREYDAPLPVSTAGVAALAFIALGLLALLAVVLRQ